MRTAQVLIGTLLIAAPAAADAPAPVTVTPYGTVFVSGFYNDGGTNNTDIPLWATSGPGNTSASVRGTRLGLKVSGAKAGDAALSAVIETDFYGGFPAVGVGDNMGVVRVRLANVRLDWTHTSVVFGQDWAVFAPLNPTSLAGTGIPLAAASGNPWARLPQLRLEGKWAHALAQAAMLAPSTGDFSAGFLAQPGSGALSQRPFLEARIAANRWGARQAGSVGVSAHAGRSRVILASGDVDQDSTAVAVDAVLPVGAHVTLSGEAFTGKNLAGFQGGIFQGLNLDSGAPAPSATPAPIGTPLAIKTRGGWAQLGVTPPGLASLSVYATAAIEDPDDDTLVSVAKHDWRLRNRTIAGSVIDRVSDRLQIGVEVRRFETRLLQSGTQRTTHVSLDAAFTF